MSVKLRVAGKRVFKITLLSVKTENSHKSNISVNLQQTVLALFQNILLNLFDVNICSSISLERELMEHLLWSAYGMNSKEMVIFPRGNTDLAGVHYVRDRFFFLVPVTCWQRWKRIMVIKYCGLQVGYFLCFRGVFKHSIWYKSINTNCGQVNLKIIYLISKNIKTARLVLYDRRNYFSDNVHRWSGISSIWVHIKYW